MTFLTVFITLLIEHLAGPQRPARRFSWIAPYCRMLARIGSLRGLMSSRWGALITLLPLLAIVLSLQLLVGAFGLVLALPFGVVVLLYSLGPRDLGDDAEDFLKARDSGAEREANAAAQAMCLTELPEGEPHRSLAVARAVIVLANRRLIAPLFWFVLFGPVGAAAYRLVHLLAEQPADDMYPRAVQQASDEIRHIADWAPARVTAAGYAIAGNFDAVAHAWRTFDYRPGDGPLDEADHLVAQTGLAALETFPDNADELAGDTGMPRDLILIPPVVEDALALVWRSLAMWVAIIAGGSLVAALA